MVPFSNTQFTERSWFQMHCRVVSFLLARSRLQITPVGLIYINLILLKTKNLLFCTGVQPINNVVIVLDEQQRDSIIHMHVSVLPQTPLPSRLAYNIEQSSMCYTVGPCWLSFLNTAVCTCQSQTEAFKGILKITQFNIFIEKNKRMRFRCLFKITQQTSGRWKIKAQSLLLQGKALPTTSLIISHRKH